MMIEIVGVSAAARLSVARYLDGRLAAVAGAVQSCRAAFSDENGPRGGVAIRCRLDVRLTRRAPIHVDGRATTVPLALKEAAARLERRLARVIGRRRAARRRRPATSRD
jgi:hypothetical protein